MSLQSSMSFSTAPEVKHPPGRHRTLGWVVVPEGEEEFEIEDAVLLNEQGVPKRLIMAHINNQLSQEAAFLTLPFAFALVLCYSLSFAIHDGASTVRNIQTAINVDWHENAVFAYSAPGYMAHKDVYDVHSFADLYTWIRLGLKPLLFKKERAWSELPIGSESPGWPTEKIAAHEKSMYLNYNRLVGGLRLTQIRAPNSECSNAEVANGYAMTCASAGDLVDINFELQPTQMDIAMSGIEKLFDVKLQRWFLLVEDPDNIDLRMKQLEVSNWIDNTTAHISAHFMSYNAHHDTLTLTEAHFFFSRSGHIFKKIVHSTFFLDNYGYTTVLIPDLLFVLLIFRLLIKEGLEVIESIREAKTPGCGWFFEYISFWNFVDWVSIVSGFVIVGIWLQVCQETSGMSDELSVISTLESGPFMEQQIQDLLEGLFKHFRDVFRTWYNFRIFGSLYLLVLMLRLFKAFDAQPRLGLVTRTLVTAAQDVAHFALVFSAIFLTYAVMGMALYGRDMEAFTDFPRACNTCFLVLMGDFDAPDMFESGRNMAGLWFWSFFVIMVLLMLNMLLAIIMDTYTDVKGAVGNTETLPQQFQNLFRRWQQRKGGERVGLHDIAKRLTAHDKHTLAHIDEESIKDFKASDWDGDENLTADGFADAVEGLGKTQATRLLRHALAWWKSGHEEALSLTEAMLVINKIYKQQADFLKNTATATKKGKEKEADGRPGSQQNLKTTENPWDVRDDALGGAAIKLPGPAAKVEPTSPSLVQFAEVPQANEKIQTLELEMKARFSELSGEVDKRFNRLENGIADLSQQLKEVMQALRAPGIGPVPDQVIPKLALDDNKQHCRGC